MIPGHYCYIIITCSGCTLMMFYIYSGTGIYQAVTWLSRRSRLIYYWSRIHDIYQWRSVARSTTCMHFGKQCSRWLPSMISTKHIIFTDASKSSWFPFDCANILGKDILITKSVSPKSQFPLRNLIKEVVALEDIFGKNNRDPLRV